MDIQLLENISQTLGQLNLKFNPSSTKIYIQQETAEVTKIVLLSVISILLILFHLIRWFDRRRPHVDEEVLEDQQEAGAPLLAVIQQD